MTTSTATGPEPAGATEAITKPKITLTGVQETLLVTLDCRRLDARLPHPILADPWAAETCGQIDYDFSKLAVSTSFAVSISLRARYLDRWAMNFIAAHKEVTILHLACGLDSRSLRLPWGDNSDGDRKVRWMDVDMPDVVALRRQLLPVPKGDYSLVAASVLDPSWLETVPNDRPTLVIMEGLTMYLPPEEGKAFLARVCARFPAGGELAFDASGWIMIWMQEWIPWLRVTGARFLWSIDDPKELEGVHERLKLVEDQAGTMMQGVEEFPLASRLTFGFWAMVPGFRYVTRMLRYAF